MAKLDQFSALAVIEERDIDLLLLEELHVNPDFAAWLAQKAQIEGLFERAWHSVSSSGLGESDLLVRYRNDLDRTILMIENKIAAAEQPDQAKRYRKRAKRLLEAGDADRTVTAMFAPAAYLASRSAAGYDLHLSYEDISAWFRSEPSARARWRADLLDKAAAATRRGYEMVEVPEMTARHRELFELLRDWPELKMNDPGPKGARSTWIVLNPASRPRGVSINLKLDLNRIDLGFKTITLDELKEFFAAEPLPEGAYLAMRGASASVSFDVPAPDLAHSLAEQTETEALLRTSALCADLGTRIARFFAERDAS